MKSQSLYKFPLESATVLEAYKISATDSLVRLFVNDVRVENLDNLKKMELKRGDVLNIIHSSGSTMHVQLLVKCPVTVE